MNDIDDMYSLNPIHQNEPNWFTFQCIFSLAYLGFEKGSLCDFPNHVTCFHALHIIGKLSMIKVVTDQFHMLKPTVQVNFFIENLMKSKLKC
jgi:hypothetical protein